MKITYDWLQDHLKTNLKEIYLLKQLTNIGLEVEGVESLSAESELFKVAKIIKTENIGKKELAATPYHRINIFVFNVLSSGHKVLCLKIENDPPKTNPKKKSETIKQKRK